MCFTPTWARTCPTKFLDKSIKFLLRMKSLEKVYNEKFLRVWQKLYVFYPNLGQDMSDQVSGQKHKVLVANEKFGKRL